MLIILGIALVIFGPRRLPEMGRTLGRALGEFRRATTDLKRSVQFEMDAEDDRQRRGREQNEQGRLEAGEEADTASPTATIATPERSEVVAASASSEAPVDAPSPVSKEG